MRELRFESNEFVLTQGENEDTCFVLIKGDIICSRYDQDLRATTLLGNPVAGDCLGSINLLHNFGAEFSCTVSEGKKAKLWSLTRSDYQHVLRSRVAARAILIEDAIKVSP